MRRDQIPAMLRVTRPDDCKRIPLAVLAKSNRADVTLRLLAADVFRARARQPHLDGSLLAGYRQLASEVLTTGDTRRYASLLKTAGVMASYSPEQLQQHLRTGCAIRLGNGHIAAVADGRDLRYWVTVAEAAAGQGTAEDSAELRRFLVRRATALGVPSQIPVAWGRPAARSTATAAGKSAALAKAAAPRSVTVATPALELVARSRSLDDGLTTLLRQGRLGEAAAELTAVAKASAGLGKAGEYRHKAMTVTDPELRQSYLELAKQAETAGSR